MNKTLKLTTVLVLCLAVAVVTFVSVSVSLRDKYDKKLDIQEIAYSEAVDSLNRQYESLYGLNHALDILKQAQSNVEKYYVFDIDEEAVKAALAQATYDILIAGIGEADTQTYLLDAYFKAIGDPYTMYHTPEEMKKLTEESEGKLYGIGIYVYLNPDTGYIYVNRVMPGSPAETAGIAEGDAITSIEGTTVTPETYSECISKVAGELNTAVKLGVVRDGTSLEISPLRGEVRAKAVFTDYVGDYAWITIMEFSGYVAEDFVSAVNEAEEKGVKGYIFDVRDNPGGDLNIICNVLDRLLPEGPIVNVMDKNQNKVYSRSSDAACISKPMTVLCNKNTASAGELFTAALKDYGIATVIGETTFGKGTMQTIIGLDDGSGVRITEYYYNPPYGENYHLKGVTPNIEVAEDKYYSDRPFLRGGESDEPFKAAITELERLISK